MINISKYINYDLVVWIALITLLIGALVALYFDLTYKCTELTVTNFKSFFAELEELSRPVIEANAYYNTFGNFKIMTEADYKDLEERFLKDIESAKQYKPTYETEPRKPSQVFEAYKSYVRNNRPIEKEIVKPAETKFIPLTPTEKLEYENNCIELEKRLT